MCRRFRTYDSRPFRSDGDIVYGYFISTATACYITPCPSDIKRCTCPDLQSRKLNTPIICYPITTTSTLRRYISSRRNISKILIIIRNRKIEPRRVILIVSLVNDIVNIHLIYNGSRAIVYFHSNRTRSPVTSRRLYTHGHIAATYIKCIHTADRDTRIFLTTSMVTCSIGYTKWLSSVTPTGSGPSISIQLSISRTCLKTQAIISTHIDTLNRLIKVYNISRYPIL